MHQTVDLRPIEMLDWKDGHETTIRVRYCETDAMGVVHHGVYPSYFEVGRTELFRAQGGSYREFEARGLFLVVVSLECKYRAPARYDDVLKLRTRLRRMTPAKLEHEYQVLRDNQILVTGRSVLACVDRLGRVQRISEELLFGKPPADDAARGPEPSGAPAP